MNSLSQYILEKFKINKNINNKFSPDDMTGDDILIYSDEPDDEGIKLQKIYDEIFDQN